MKYQDEDLSVILLDSVIGLEYKHKIKLISLLKGRTAESECPKAVRDYLFDYLGESKAKTIIAALTEKSYREFVLNGLSKAGTVCVTIRDGNYPRLLKEIDQPPIVLYCNGNVKLLESEHLFAIVGSRKCLPYALALATDFSKELSASGVTIVTGSAGGADKAAIDGAAGSGNLICVLAGGINYVYPKYHKTVIEKISEIGLVISEQPPDYPPKPWMFPARNRIISGLSEGVLIVGGERDSGARHYATYAAEYGRDVLAFPYSVGIKSGELNNDLIKSGAMLCDSVDDVFRELKIERSSAKVQGPSGDALSVYNAVKSGFEDVNTIIAETGFKIYELAPLLSELEIEGYIVKMAGNKYKTVK